MGLLWVSMKRGHPQGVPLQCVCGVVLGFYKDFAPDGAIYGVALRWFLISMGNEFPILRVVLI